MVGAASLLLGALISDLAAKLLAPRKCNTSSLIILHRLTFKSPENVEVFKAAWGKLADACFQNVEDCLSFELSTSTESDLSLLVFERHARQGHFQNKHDVLAALSLDREKAGVESYELETFLESDLGHMERW